MSWTLLWWNLKDARLLSAASFAMLGIAMLPDLSAPLFPVLLFSLAIHGRQRGSHFELSLPISARRVVLLHALKTLMLVLVPMLIWVISMRVMGPNRISAEMMKDMLGFELWTVPHIIEFVLAIVLSVLVPFGIKPASIAGPSPLVAIVCLLTVGAVFGIASWLLPDALALPLLAVVSVATCSVIWKRIPSTLQVAPLLLKARAPIASAHGRLNIRSGRATLSEVWPLARTVLTGRLVFSLLMLFFMSALDTMSPLLWTGSLLLGSYELLRQQTRWTSALPLSARVRASFVLVPTVLLGSLCVTLGPVLSVSVSSFYRTLYRNAPSTYKHGERYFESRTKVPLQYWKRADDGGVPVIRSPWGETAPAFTFTAPGLLFYNPYSSVRASSDRFIDWQLGRATAVVYGRAMKESDYDWENKPLPRPTVYSFTVWSLETSVVLSIVLFMAFCLELARSKRFYASKVARHGFPFLGILIPALALAIDLRYGTFNGVQVVKALMQMAFMHFEQRFHPNLLLVLMISAVPVVIMYLLVERQFREAELPRLVQKRVGA